MVHIKKIKYNKINPCIRAPPHRGTGEPNCCTTVMKLSCTGTLPHRAQAGSRDLVILLMGLSVVINTGHRDRKFPSALLKMFGNVSAGR